MKNYRNISLVLLTFFMLGLSPVLVAEERKSKPMNIKADPATKRPAENSQSIAEGKALYNKSCVFCHGVEGAGDGSVSYFLSRDTGPHPRDFTYGIYKFRSTPSGYLPADEDLMRTITMGVKGFMPPFSGMKESDRWKVVYFIKSLYPDFQEEETEYLKVAGSPQPFTAESVQKGYKVYQQFKCWECHGSSGVGDGTKAAKLVDDWGYALPPQNLTMPSSFKNGNNGIDLYRTIMGGLDGGAMPSYADFFEGKEDDVWHLINYINSISAE